MKDAGLTTEQEAAREELVEVVRGRWLSLLAGPLGYDTRKEWRGIDSQDVASGEMVGCPGIV